MDIFLIICLVILLYLLYINIKKEYNIVPFSKEHTSIIRGVAITIIILHHIAQKYPLGIMSYILTQVGYIFTGVFFLISGYGNNFSIEKNNSNYGYFLWLINRFLRIIISFIIVDVPFIILTMVTGYIKEMSIFFILKSILTLSTPFYTIWYLKIQIILYLFTYISYLISKKHTILLINTLCILLVVILWYFDFPSFWWNSLLCYPIGFMFAKYKEKLNFNNIKFKLLIVFAIFLIPIYFITGKKFAILSIMSCLVSVVIIISLSSYCIGKSKLFSNIGNISLECYLVHLVWIKIFQAISFKESLEVVIILVSTIVSAEIVAYISIKIQNLVSVRLNRSILNE